MVFLQKFEVTPLDSEIDKVTNVSNSMAKIVLDTIQNGEHNFVSTLDHLPCDIVRCLWLIQSLELRNLRLKQQLFNLFESNINGEYSHDSLSEIKHLNSIINRNLLEVKTESNYLVDLLNIHINLIHDEQHLSDLIKEKLKNWTSEKVETQWKEWCAFKTNVISNDKSRPSKPSLIPGLKIRIRFNSNSVETSSISPERSISASPPLSISKSNKKRESSALNRTSPGELSLQSESYSLLQPQFVEVTKPKPKILVDKPKIYSDEPNYCTCNGPAAGRMVGCENNKCPRGEWFHFKCVGITQEPMDSWFCSKDCENAHNRSHKKKRRKW